MDVRAGELEEVRKNLAIIQMIFTLWVQQVKEKRIAHLYQLQAELQSIWKILGGPVDAGDVLRYESIDEQQLGENRVLSFEAAIKQAQAERTRRTEEAAALRDEINDLRVLLAARSTTEKEGELTVTKNAIAEQKSILAWLQKERLERENRIKALAREITPLWDLLAVSVADRQQFFETNSGLGTEVIAAV